MSDHVRLGKSQVFEDMRRSHAMARVLHRKVLAEGEIQVIHFVNRCARRGFLSCVDSFTGNDYEHRRQWQQLSCAERQQGSRRCAWCVCGIESRASMPIPLNRLRHGSLGKSKSQFVTCPGCCNFRSATSLHVLQHRQRRHRLEIRHLRTASAHLWS